MRGDMDPKNWSVGDWVLVPTAIVVAWIVMLVMEY